MGVTDLWEVLHPVGHSRSFKHLAVSDGFESNASGRRAYRIGIDCSLWYQQVQGTQGSDKGENPLLRGLFFKVKALALLPFLPVFVIDGRNRPKMKRGSKMGKSGSHPLNKKMKELLGAFGMEWREAEGEAEAELAYLNRTGVIDAVLTDDVDAFVFGAQTVIRNVSLGLSGNKSNPATDLNGNKSKHHCMVYRAEDIQSKLKLTRGGLILYALLAGGDYDPGVIGIGKVVARILAKCDFGDRLLRAYDNRHEESFDYFLVGWREELDQKLRTVKPGMRIPPNFPDFEIFRYYANPATSETARRGGGGHLRDDMQMSITKVASLCEEYFEWGIRSVIIKRFRSFRIWEGAIMTLLRRAALEEDEREITSRQAAGNRDTRVRGVRRPTGSNPPGPDVSLIRKYLDRNMDDYIAQAFVNRGPQARVTQMERIPLIKILKKEKAHVSTDFMDEYQIEVDPEDFVHLALKGIKGTRPESHEITGDETDTEEEEEEQIPSSQSPRKKSKSKKKDPDPCDPYKMKCPASILINVDPCLVEAFEQGITDKERKKQEAEIAKAEKARDRERKKQEKATAKEEKQKERERKKKEKEEKAALSKSKGKGKGKRKATTPDSDVTVDESSDSSPSPQKKRKPNKKTSATSHTGEARGASTVPRTSDGLAPFPLSRSPSMDFPGSLPPSSPFSSPTKASYASNMAPSSSAQPGPSQSKYPQLRDDEAMDIDDDDIDLRGGFLFTLPESDNPDHLEREDLNGRFRKDLPTQATWSEVAPALNTSERDVPEENEDMYLQDDMLDKRHQAAFMSQAHSSRKTTKPTNTLSQPNNAIRASEKSSSATASSSQPAKRLVRLTPVPSKRPSPIPDVFSAPPAPKIASGSSTSEAPSRRSVSDAARRRHSSPLFTPNNLLRSTTPPFPDSITTEPQSSLFLPSPSHIPVRTHRPERHSSATSTQSTSPLEAINLASDDEDVPQRGMDFPSSGSYNTAHLQRLYAKRAKSASRPPCPSRPAREFPSDVIDLT